MARNVFTSENAFAGHYLATTFGNDPTLVRTFDRIKTDLNSLKDPEVDTYETREYVHEFLSQRTETYEQPITSFGDGEFSNVYSYLRSKDGYPGECNLISAPLNYRASVTYLLTFVELMSKHQPDWLSRDLVILFYEQSDYSTAVKEFLDAYYHKGLTRLRGRCGYLRQSFPLVIKDNDFTKISMMLEGVNS